MPEEDLRPTAKQFPNSASLISWIRTQVYAARESGKEPVKVTLPIWAESILATCSREMIGDKACEITQNGVRGCLLKFFNVGVEWDAAELEVVLPEDP